MKQTTPDLQAASDLMTVRSNRSIPVNPVVRDSDTHPYCLGCRV